MVYLCSKEFIKIAEVSGTVQNTSKIRTLEMSESDEIGSGILIYPLQKHSFKDTEIWLRCVDGAAEARVVPFELDSKGGEGNVGTVILNGVSYHIASNSDILSLLNSTFDSEG